MCPYLLILCLSLSAARQRSIPAKDYDDDITATSTENGTDTLTFTSPEEAELSNDTSSVDQTTMLTDPTTTKRICDPSCRVKNITHDTITLQESNCCNNPDQTLKWEAVTTAEYTTECNCRNHSKSVTDHDCQWSLSGLCPNTEYFVQLEASGSSEINCTKNETLKTKPAAPTKAIWEKLEVLNETAVELIWKAPRCLNGDNISYKVSMHWTGTTKFGPTIKETQMTLGNLLPKTSYEFQVIACNSMDKNLCSKSAVQHNQTKPGKPSPPRNFTSKVVSSRTIALSWSEPTTLGGSSVDGYQILYCRQGISGVGNTTEVVGSEPTSIEITGLEPGKTYLFTVRAYHKEVSGGEDQKLFGESSIEIEATTYPEKPSVPRNLVASNITSNQVTLTWDEPEIKNGRIDGYLVKWTSHSGKGGSKNITDLKYTVQGLLPWNVYDFSVSAFNLHEKEQLLGPAERVSSTTAPSEPSAPTNFTASAVNSSAIQLKWDRPEHPRGPIDRYNIVCLREENDTALENITLTPEESQDELVHLVSGLQPWTNYTCLIWAVNMDGNESLSGEPSDVTTRTRQDKPSAPRNLVVANRTSTEVYLTWNVPERPNGPLDGYRVSWFPEASSAIQENLEVNVTSVTISDLLPWKEYHFSVLAFNKHCEDERGPLEGLSDTVTVKTRPSNPGGPPEEFSITIVKARSLGVSWKAPGVPNGPIDGYYVSHCLSGHDCLSTNKTEQLEMNFTNLEPYRTYTIKVCAYNLDEENVLEGPCGNITRNTSVDAPSVPTDVICEGAITNELKMVWNVPDKLNGPLDGFILRWRQVVQDNHNDDNWQNIIRNITDLQGPVYRKSICDLLPYTRYQIGVSAFNLDDGGTSLPLIGESVEVSCRTDVGAPEAPTLDVSRVSADSVELIWNPPTVPNGPLEGYQLMWKLRECPPNGPISCSDESSVILNSGNDSFVINNLLPWSNYTFGLLAYNLDRNNKFFYSAKSVQERQTHAGVPEYPAKNLTSLEAFDTQIQFLFPKILFQEGQGPIVRYAVVVAGLDNTANISTYHRRQSNTNEAMGTWIQAKKNNPMPLYQASPVSWNPYNSTYDPFQCQDHVSEDNDVIGKKCIIGAERECNDTTPYCNGPLHSGNYYAVKIRGFTDGGWSETHPLEVFVEPSKMQSSSSTGVAVAVSLTLILLLAAALIGGVFMKKKGLWPQKTATPTTASKREDLNTPMTPIPQRRTGTCILVSAFGNHVAVMLSDSGLKFSQEFEELKAASPELPSLLANLPGNKPKNRWANILPFDHSRVKLRPISDDQETDYINASYIPGNSSRREYIATQGPLPSTKDDFWRMIWEQNVSMVVMLTLCVERGKAKCEQYWRDDWEPHYHGDDCIKVVKISESILSAYTIRIFDIQMGGHQRSVKHMHFTKWPDFGCPENPEILINFVRAVRDHLPHSRPSPILVHCSAGVGRTGTFIAVDRLMQQVRDKSEYLDAYRMVLEMRDHRCSMVQTEDQYIYIHECVREIIHDEQERTQTPVSNGFEIYSNLNFNQGE